MKSYELISKRFGNLTVKSEGKTVKVKNGTRKYLVCKCDCGNESEVIAYQLTSGKTKSCGCLKKQTNKNRSGKNHHNWKGGRHKSSEGYVKVLEYGHPNSHKNGYIREHVLVMSNHIGRPLMEKETVHHKNGIKDDNRIENLELWSCDHPSGQRIQDKVDWCVDFLKKYAPEKLKV